MRHTIFWGIAFGFLGSLLGGIVGGSYAFKSWQAVESVLLGGGFGAVFGAILGLSMAVDEIRDRLDAASDFKAVSDFNRRLPPRVGDLELPRFQEETPFKGPLPIHDQIESRPPTEP